MWVKLDDGFFRNPKARAVGQRGRELYLASLCWSAANLTDGYIPRSAASQVGADAGIKAASVRSLYGRLSDAGLVHGNGDGWVIHDFLEFQPSKADTLVQRERHREAQRRYMQRRKSGVIDH